MEESLIASASTTIDAPVTRVWRALVTPALIKRYMFGTTVVCDWKEGDAITWRGEWKGEPYEDKGVILRLEPGRTLSYSHWSPLSGLPDAPESRHTVTIALSGEGGRTHVTLDQDRNRNEEAREHSRKNWQQMLEGLKKVVEES